MQTSGSKRPKQAKNLEHEVLALKAEVTLLRRYVASLVPTAPISLEWSTGVAKPS
jgi:hypothetical protein